MPVGPFAPESKTGVPKIAERGAPGRFTLPLIRIDGPALRAPLISSKTRAKAAGTKRLVLAPPRGAVASARHAPLTSS